jgi:hypothetical protein
MEWPGRSARAFFTDILHPLVQLLSHQAFGIFPLGGKTLSSYYVLGVIK